MVSGIFYGLFKYRSKDLYASRAKDPGKRGHKAYAIKASP